jgi:hypothetical protein
MKFELLAAIALPVFTALLYLIGLSHHEGYLEVYGLDSSQFPIPSDKALFAGFITLSLESMALRLVSISIVCIGFILYLKYFTRLSLNSYLFKHLKSNNLNDENSIENQHPLLVLISISSTFFILIFIFIIIAITAYGSGKRQANSEHIEYEKKKTTVVNIRYKQNDNETNNYENAKLVTCNTNACAYWIKNESHILQLDRIEKISLMPKEYVSKIVK